MTQTSNTPAITAPTTQPYTDAQATDEAVLMLVRKLRRLHTDAYVDVMGKLSPELRDVLTMADLRADALRHADSATGTVRTFAPAWVTEDDVEGDDEG